MRIRALASKNLPIQKKKKKWKEDGIIVCKPSCFISNLSIEVRCIIFITYFFRVVLNGIYLKWSGLSNTENRRKVNIM